MELKTIKPAYCAFAEFGNILKDFAVKNTPVSSNRDFCGIDKSNSRAFSKTHH
jgi:hypothetical protein